MSWQSDQEEEKRKFDVINKQRIDDYTKERLKKLTPAELKKYLRDNGKKK